MYASSDVNIVMMMFFGLFLLRKISNTLTSDLADDLKVVVRVPLGNSDIFLSKNSSKNIIITIHTFFLFLAFLKLGWHQCSFRTL